MANDIRGQLPLDMETVKSKLFDAMIDAIRASVFLSPNVELVDTDPDDYDGVKLFDFVEPGVLDDIKRERTPEARLEQGEEQVHELMFPITEKRFRLYVHFKIIRVVGVDPLPLINYYFGRITEILVTPDHFANIAIDISEVGNSPQSQGMNDPEPGGTIWFDVDIRHGYGNHFSETGNG